LRVLIVEDDSDLRIALSEYLQTLGYQVHLADHGDRALELAAQHPVDLIVLDWQLPGATGVPLLSGLRKLTTGPILVMSGDSISLKEAQAANADLCVAKPFLLRELADAIAQLLGSTP
jgi:two-component system KDP operon response regulator KdpE